MIIDLNNISIIERMYFTQIRGLYNKQNRKYGHTLNLKASKLTHMGPKYVRDTLVHPFVSEPTCGGRR